MSKIGFIGCGNMGGALARAVSKAGYKDLFLSDRDDSKLSLISDELNAVKSTAIEIAEVCDFIFIGVKPQVISQCFEEISEILSKRNDVIVVSMAAGVCVDKIRNLSHINSIIRIMPNMPVSVGEGVVLASHINVSDENKKVFEDVMSCVGIFNWIDEKLIDAASALSGCGPAFVYMFIEALADGAVACGLPRDKAILFAAGTVCGSAKSVIESGKHPELLKDAVCSPAGSTIMGVKALEDGGFRSAAFNAVIEAYKKTKELG